MIRQVNAPVELETVQCYKCHALLKIHPMADVDSPWIKNCSLHIAEKMICNHNPVMFYPDCRTCILNRDNNTILKDGIRYAIDPYTGEE